MIVHSVSLTLPHMPQSRHKRVAGRGLVDAAGPPLVPLTCEESTKPKGSRQCEPYHALLIGAGQPSFASHIFASTFCSWMLHILLCHLCRSMLEPSWLNVLKPCRTVYKVRWRSAHWTCSFAGLQEKQGGAESEHERAMDPFEKPHQSRKVE